MTGPSHSEVALDAEIRAANEASLLAREKARDAGRAASRSDKAPGQAAASDAPTERRQPAAQSSARAAVPSSPAAVSSPSPPLVAKPKPGPTADGGLVLSPSQAKAMVEMMNTHPDYSRYTRPKGTRR